MNPSDIGGRPAPWPNTYRVPGEHVIAGEYPGPLRQHEQVRDRLGRLLDEGVRAFVDLTQEADGLDPYVGILAEVAAERGVEVVHHPLGMPDMDVPTPAHMQRVLDTVDAELARGHGVYVHCWGGIGRTGTVVGCLFVRRGQGAEQALHNVQAAYATMAKVTKHPASPQTTSQRRFVRDWAAHEARAHALPLREHLRVAQPRESLLAAHPPRFVHPHKQRIAERLLAAPAPAGEVSVTRWSLDVLPATVPPRRPAVVLREGFFRYDPADETPGTVHWHLNFADTHLFGFYAGGLLAQDELQVLEHPVLGAVREWLLTEGHAAYTMEGDVPTPVLVTGAERRAHLRTAFVHEGRNVSLYGNAFAVAPAPLVDAAVVPIEPPTLSNIIAVAAPAHGHGAYTAEEIDGILRAATAAFGAAVRESQRLTGAAARTVIHTGWWGCGAFGGNRQLMAMLQFAAAQLAGVDAVVFHRGFDDTADEARVALDAWASRHRLHGETARLVEAIEAEKYRWGVGNGT